MKRKVLDVVTNQMCNSSCTATTKDQTDGLSTNTSGQSSKVAGVREALRASSSCYPSVLLDATLNLFLQIFESDHRIWIFRRRGFLDGENNVLTKRICHRI